MVYNKDKNKPAHTLFHSLALYDHIPRLCNEGEGEGEVAFFSAKRWDRRNRADLIESATPCHDT